MNPDVSLLAKVSEDRAIGSAVLFKKRHDSDGADFHIEMLDLWRSVDELVAIEAFREGGKSTICEEAILMEAAFGNFNYWLLIGETYTKACQRLEAIKHEAQQNVRLHHLFGGLVLSRKPTENRLWFKSGALIEAVGWEQELQSFKHYEYRPDGAWLDDIENMERVRDSAAVDANWRKFWLELWPALTKRRRRVRFTQTRRAEDCMMVRFSNSPECLYRGYPICNGEPDDPVTKSNWPARYPMEWIRAEKAKFEGNGMLQEFRQAYMLEVTDPASKPFKAEMLRKLDASPWHWMPRFAIYDPSRTANVKRTATHHRSDRYGKVVVSRLGSQILVHESGGFHWAPNEMIADLFATNDRHQPAKIGVEKNSLDDWIMQPIRLEMLRRGRTLPVEALQAPQDRSKDDFIMGLQPFAQAGDIVLVGGVAAHPQLVAEWSNYPQGPRDILNALAYSLRMFSGQPVYEDFGPANIGEAPIPKRGETVYVGVSGTPADTVMVAVVREGRRLHVAFDRASSGTDAAKNLAFELRATFPLAAFSVWAPAELHDQWQRVPLVSQLRAAGVTAYRGEHAATNRGCLADRIRTEWQHKRLLVVDRKATLTLNALSTGYARVVERGGRVAGEPQPGLARLAGEAIEVVAAMLDKAIGAEDGSIPKGAHVGISPTGAQYVTANPRAAR